MVYKPREDSELLKKYVKKYAFGRVLDMGTGSGIQAIEAGKKEKVSSVLAVDIDSLVIENLKNKIENKTQKERSSPVHLETKSPVSRKSKDFPGSQKSSISGKIEFIVSDLFSKVKGKFDTVIFNPPYLPEDIENSADKVTNLRNSGVVNSEKQHNLIIGIDYKGVEDKALYGGKKGYEVLEKFLNSVGDYLSEKGVVLIVFSSLTNKEKVNQIIERNLLEFKESEKKHFFFEDLFVYKIVKSKVLQELEKKKISGIKYFARGKRGNVFVGHYKNKKAAIKVKRKSSLATGRMKNEVKWLKVLNKKNIGPRLLFHGKNYLVYEFVEGDFILDWVKKAKKGEIKKVLVSVLKQCFEMDKLGVNKEEMHRPIKHIIVDKKGKAVLIEAGGSKTSGISKTVPRAVLIDFERCYKTGKPHNATQFGAFLMNHKLVKKMGFTNLLKSYKKEQSKKNLIKIIKSLK